MPRVKPLTPITDYSKVEKNIKIAVEDLQNEGKKIAFIKKGRKIIAVVGYKVA